jgi:hypothetical protein
MPRASGRTKRRAPDGEGVGKKRRTMPSSRAYFADAQGDPVGVTFMPIGRSDTVTLSRDRTVATWHQVSAHTVAALPPSCAPARARHI